MFRIHVHRCGHTPRPTPLVSALVQVCILFPGAGLVSAQSSPTIPGQAFPYRPIRIITSEIGGGGDLVSRVIGQGLTTTLGQQVIIDNRPPSAPEIFAKAQPDGHTMMLYGNAVWTAPLMRTVPWDPVKDFEPVMVTGRTPHILVVTPSLSVTSIKDLIATARARPGELNYASSSAGSSTHLAAELFIALSGVNLTRIDYKGVAQAVTDIIGGRVQLMFATAGAVAPHIKTGKLRALAVTSTQPSALFPGLPTVAASGVPGYESAAQFGLFVPSRTPEAIIALLNQETVRVLNKPEIREKLLGAGIEVVGSSPDQLAATIRGEMARFGKVIKDSGIRPE